jgi:hypothetical protein
MTLQPSPGCLVVGGGQSKELPCRNWPNSAVCRLPRAERRLVQGACEPSIQIPVTSIMSLDSPPHRYLRTVSR